MYGEVDWFAPAPFAAPSVDEDVPLPGWSTRQSTLYDDYDGTVCTHSSFRAVGFAVGALLHDGGRGLGIAHGRRMYESFRAGREESRRVGCSGGKNGSCFYTSRVNPRSGNDAIKSSGMSNTGVRDNWESSRGKIPPIGDAAACLRVYPIVARADKDKDGSGPTCNHKMSTGLPDAGTRRLFRSSMRKPFRGHTAQYLSGIGR